MDRHALQLRLDHVHDRMVQHAIPELGRRDPPRLGVVDLEEAVAAQAHPLGQQVLAQRVQTLTDLLAVAAHGVSILLAAPSLQVGAPQIVGVGDRVVESAGAARRRQEVAGARNTTAASAPPSGDGAIAASPGSGSGIVPSRDNNASP